MKHKYLYACALWISAHWGYIARAQPPDAGQPRAGQMLTPAQEQEHRQRQQQEAEATERLTPEGLLRQFALALNQNNLLLAARTIEGEPSWGDLRRIEARMQGGQKQPQDWRLPQVWSFDLLPLLEQAPEGKNEFEARVLVTLKRRDPLGLEDDSLLGLKTTFVERVMLRRPPDGEWKIVPRPALALPERVRGDTVQAQIEVLEANIQAARDESDGFLNTWARAIAQPRKLLLDATSRASRSNIKQLLLGVLMLSQDYNEKLAFTPADFQDKLQPYVKSRALFEAPILDEEKAFSYTLNPSIAGMALAAFSEPARTVAIYEADKDGKPLFRFDGKCAIGFMDGHVEMVTPEKAATLVWKF